MNEENPKNEKKPITLKNLIIKRILFIIIFAIIAGGITAYFVIKNRPTVNTNSNSEALSQIPTNEIITDNEVPENTGRNHISLLNFDTDTFDYNDLKIDEIKENYNNCPISYYQIDGLKNKYIQDKINNELKIDLIKAIDNCIAEGKKIKNSESFVYSSFANTLSIGYRIIFHDINDDLTELTKLVTKNYDLTTGNIIKFKDLFTDDTIGSDIFNNDFYKQFIQYHVELDSHYDYTVDDWPYNTVKNYNDIEEKMLEIIIKFNEGKDFQFYFTEQLVILPELSNVQIFFDEHLDFIAIYNRYKTSESIFDGKYPNLHNLPVLTRRDTAITQNVLEETDNYYIDTSLSISYDCKNQEAIINSALNYMNSDIEEIKNDNNKFYIYNATYQLSLHNRYIFDIYLFIKKSNRKIIIQ